MAKTETAAHTLQSPAAESMELWSTEVLDVLPTPLLLIEPGTARMLFANKAADRMAGGTFPRDVPADQYHAVYNCTDAHGRRIPEDAMPWVRVARGEQFDHVHIDWHLPGGTRSLLVQGTVRAPRPGAPPMGLIVFQDVTALEQPETAPTELEQHAEPTHARTADVLDTIADGFLAFDRDWRFTYLNREGARTLGRSANELIGKNLWQEFPDLASTSFGRLYQRAMNEDRPLELEDYYPPFDGWFVARAYPSPSGLSIYFLNVTERKQIELRLRASEERYRAFIENSSEAIWCFELEQPIAIDQPEAVQIEQMYQYGYLSECNITMAQTYDFNRPEDMVGLRLREIMPQSEQANIAYLQAFVHSGYQLSDVESIEVDKHGTAKHMLNNLTGVIEQGKLVRAWGTSRDMTERKAAAEAIARNEERYRSIFQLLPVSIWEEDWSAVLSMFHDLRAAGVTDWVEYFDQHPEFVTQALQAVRILDINEATLRLFDARTKAELLGSLQTVFSTPDTLPGFVSELIALGTGKQWFETEMSLRTTAHDLVDVLLTMSFPAPESNSGIVLVSLMDITTRKRAEERMVRLQEVTAALAEALTAADIAQVIDVAVSAMGASAGSLSLRTDDGAEIEMIRAVGYPAEVIEQFWRFPLNAPLPISDAVRNGETIWLETSAAKLARYPNLSTVATHSQAIAAIPLYSEGHAIGALGLSFNNQRTFSDDDKAFMLAIARQCALALERVRLYGALHTALDRAQHHTAQLRNLTTASLSINTARSLDDVLRTITEQARTVIGVHQAVASLTIGDDISQAINTVVLSDKYAQWRAFDQHPEGLGIYALVCQTNTPMRLTEAELEAHPAWRHFSGHADKHPPMRGWLAAPLVGRDGRNIGLLQLSDKESGDFTIEDEAVLVQLANIASVALENTRLYEEAQVAERAKEEARALLDTLFASAPIGLAFFDPDLRYVQINEAMATINGRPVEQHLGRKLQEVLPAIPQHVVDMFHHVLNTGEPLINQEVAGWNPAEPGQRRYWLSSYYRVPGPNEPLGVGVVVQEITERKRAETSLRESEERYRTLFNSIDEGFCVIEMLYDPDGKPVDYRFLEVNQLFEQQTGLHGAVGKTARELVPGLEAHWFDIYGKVALTGESVRFEQGSEAMNRWFDVYAFRLGEPERRYVAILFKDVSERKRSDLYQRFLTEASALLVASLDYETTLKNLARLVVLQIADWCAIDLLEENGTLLRVTVEHADPEKVALARDLQRRFPPDPNAPYGVAQVIRTGRPQLLPTISDDVLTRSISDPDLLAIMRGLGLCSSMVVPLIAGGRTLGTITFVAAESERRFDIRDLELAEDLARRAAVAVDNARLYRAAQQAISARDEFLSIASHELKTPLTSLQLQAQTLLRAVNKGDHEKLTPERLAQKFRTIGQQTQRLTRLAEDLLDVSRISMGRISFNSEELDIAEVIHEVAGRFEEQLRMAGCELHLDVPTGVVLRSDRGRLEQILTNLLSNAIKYGPGKPITVRVDADDAQVRIQVQDQGIGIAPEHLERIFIRFERAVSAQNYGGLGLGLYIVRQIVEALGGTIGVQSTLDAGSIFTVTLPRGRT